MISHGVVIFIMVLFVKFVDAILVYFVNQTIMKKKTVKKKTNEKLYVRNHRRRMAFCKK